CDIYPIIPLGIRPMYALNPDGRQGDLSNTTPSQVGDYVDKMRKVSGDHRPLCMVLQGFAWEMLRAPAERDSTKILYPDYKSSWFMAWDAIIHGVNGLIWWGTAYTPAGHLFHKELKQVVQRLSSLSPALSLPAKNRPFHVEYDEPGHSVDKGVELLIKEDDLNLWLFTANREYYPLKADIRIGLPPATANVLYEGRTIQISAEGFSDSFGPYEVHLYHLTKKH
ncbi:MAG: hypothetical protein LWW85_13270, partial [Marinilabiliales bacterium]|nr:hypothetical protein [Marinilabiliales bacterium]